MFREKENAYREILYQKLKMCKHNSVDFWKFIRKIENTNNVQKCNITDTRWVQYYEKLLNKDVQSDQEFMEQCHRKTTEHDENCKCCYNTTPGDDNLNDVNMHLEMLNDEITVLEVKEVIIDIKKGKSPGCDGLVVELFQKTVEMISPRLCNLYNIILDSSEFPEIWSRAIICSLHKGGDVNCETNYRGISLLNICGKIFPKILNNRLVTWANSQGQYYEEQAGYREGYSTVDHIFSLYTLTQKYLSKPNGRFYVLFVDFSKAFDKIPHRFGVDY